MRTKITIIFESHGLGTATQDNDWEDELLNQVGQRLKSVEGFFENITPTRTRWSLVTFEIVSVERLAEE